MALWNNYSSNLTWLHPVSDDGGWNVSIMVKHHIMCKSYWQMCAEQCDEFWQIKLIPVFCCICGRASSSISWILCVRRSVFICCILFANVQKCIYNHIFHMYLFELMEVCYLRVPFQIFHPTASLVYLDCSPCSEVGSLGRAARALTSTMHYISRPSKRVFIGLMPSLFVHLQQVLPCPSKVTACVTVQGDQASRLHSF